MIGVRSTGIVLPFIKEGDDIVESVVDSVLKSATLNDKDVIGITESVIARATGQYVTVDDIAVDIEEKYGKGAVINIINPIYSRNRFSMILKGIARAAKKIIFTMPDFDEVGNPYGINPFTGVNIKNYYKEICNSENCEAEFVKNIAANDIDRLYCGLHDYDKWKIICYTLADICSDVSPDWGLLGTNKATEERLKLFPSKEIAQKVCDEVKSQIKNITGKDVIVCSYGDGCFKDPVGGIWEFADPITMPAYTDKELIESTPNEIKLKAFLDQNVDKEEINKLINQKDKNLVGSMTSQGTTPRLYRDLLASLMDLTSGSGDRATPVVVIQNYFR